MLGPGRPGRKPLPTYEGRGGAIPWKDLVAPGPVAVPGQARAVPPRAGDSWRVNFSRVEWPLIEADDGYRKEREPVDW